MTVAIKFLPAALSDSEQARTRFEREARAIAALNHPTLRAPRRRRAEAAALHRHGVPRRRDACGALGEGPFPLDELLVHGIEIVSGLEQRIAAGIVHRDLKPANIVLTKGGAKLLDFGLAGLRPTLFERDTVTDRAVTHVGQMMGTLQYMAPEQVEGKESDARTDLFACGLVLYEMATGRRAFEGPNSAAIITRILTGEPLSIRDIQPTYSSDLDWAIRRCLERDPQDRWQTATDLSGGAAMDPQAVGCAGARDQIEDLAARCHWRSAAAIALGALAISAVTWFVASRRPTPPPPTCRRCAPSFPSSPTRSSARMERPRLALSADGRRLVYAAAIKGTTGLYVRRLDRLDATRLPGTDGGTNPFFSADGTAVGFFAEGKLKTVSLDGSSPRVICDAPRGRGGSWETANTIVFAPSSDTPLFRVDAGRRPARTSHDAQHVPARAFASLAGCAAWRACRSLHRGKFHRQQLQRRPGHRAIARRSQGSPGHREWRPQCALCGRAPRVPLGSSLVAAPFDPERAELTGDPLTIVDSLSTSRYVAAAQFAVSGDGSLIYLPPGGEARRHRSHGSTGPVR